MNIESLRSQFINVSNTQELLDNVADKLDNLCEYKIQQVQGSVRNFKCIVDCNIADANAFIASYNEKSNETLKISSTKRTNSTKNVFVEYKYFRCHHNTRYQPTMNFRHILVEKPFIRFKNKDCPFSLILKFRRDKNADFNCMLVMEWTHNHPINSLQSLSYKQISKQVRDQIFDYFEKGLTPGLAYREHWRVTQHRRNMVAKIWNPCLTLWMVSPVNPAIFHTSHATFTPSKIHFSGLL